MEFAWSARQQTAFDNTLDAVRGAWGTTTATPDGFYRRDDWKQLGALGLLGLCVPEAFGGGGLGALDTAIQIEALGRGCDDTGLVFAASAHLFACTMPIAEFGRDDLRRRFLPGMCCGDLIAGNAMTEAGAGSDVSRLAVTATEAPGGYVLDGEKSFVTNGPVADLFVTYATTDPAAGHLGVTAFAVPRDRPGIEVGEPFAKMGLRSAPAGRVRFDECFVPAEFCLGEPGGGGAIFARSMRWERSCLFAGYLGVMDRTIERCVAHARSRRQFGRSISGFQAVANRIVEMKLRAESARLLLYRACWQLDRGIESDLDVALAKLVVSEGVVATALDAVNVFGGAGYLDETGIERILRDAVPSTIFSGTSDIQRMLVAQGLGL